MSSRLSSFVMCLEKLSGWRRALAVLAIGALSVFAFPPFNVVPLLWLCFPVLIFILRGAKTRWSAFACGWLFSFGMLVPNLYWIAGAMFVDIGTFWWVVPFAIAGLPAFFAFYYGLATLAARRLFDLNRAHGITAFALLWALADYARGHLFTGFPWDIMGYVWGEYLPVMQLTSVVGIAGLTLLTMLAVVLPAVLGSQSSLSVTARRALIVFGVAFFVVAAGWGEWRLQQATQDVVPDVRLRLVQPAIHQKDKWRYEEREDNFQRLLTLSFAPAEKPVTAIVWPETATAFYLNEDVPHRLAIASLLGENTKLITGAVQRSIDPVDDRKYDYFNSLVAMDHSGYLIAGYDKFHLVPFGEYIPFRDFIPIKAISQLGINFMAGDGLHSLRLKGLPAFSPLVCYEAIFSGEVASRQDPPAFMINVTNDGWYEGTTGPSQHFSLVRVRAIEEGIPLVRVSNMGTTAIVDGYGRVRESVGAETQGFVDGDLPVTTVARTLFSLYDDAGAFSIFVIFAVFVIYGKLLCIKNGDSCGRSGGLKK